MEKEILFELFITKDLSQREVGKHIGCSQSTVRHFLKKYKIIKNTKNCRNYEQEITEKKCYKCKEVKPIVGFYKVKKKSGVMTDSSWCKECNTKEVVKRNKNTKSLLVRLRGGSCQICKFCEYDGALEFHHIDPEKKDDRVSKLIRLKISKDIVDEINKCALLCSNCHKMVHAGIKQCPEPIIINYETLI